jgi:hypothetical protein
MRILIGTAICAALIAPSAQSAKTVQEPVLVVSHKTFHVLAWDSGSKLCTELVATGRTASGCASPRKLGVVQLAYAAGGQTFIGGTASSRAKTVEALFANGATLKLRSAAGRRYHGRRHGRVRFFGGAEKGVTTLAKLTARDAHGHAIQTLKLPATAPPPGPTPQPPTPPPCTPCPPVKNHACPLVACATPTDAWTSSW